MASKDNGTYPEHIQARFEDLKWKGNDIASGAFSYTEENRNCGEDVKVKIIVKNGKLKDYSFDGHLSFFTIVSLDLWGDKLVGMDVSEILDADYYRLEQSVFNMEIPKKRELSAAAGLLVMKNAIHAYIGTKTKDGKPFRLDFSDIIG